MLFPFISKQLVSKKCSGQAISGHFQSQDRQATCTIINDGTDLEICCHGETKRYEVKGTADGEVAYHKLKVSSKASHGALVSGTTLIRVTNVGQPNVQLHFLHHGTISLFILCLVRCYTLVV
jgi:hypothetical protein